LAIYYFDGNIIGRSSGRSAVGAAAYRRSAKMQSVAHAAYQRGEKIIEEGDHVTHDYRAKSGVVHSEIMLPDGAPPGFMDAQTLWNAVENKEKRKDAQLAREFIVGLQREFTLEEQIEVLREYIQENFVDKGMCADFSVHNKKDDNPHIQVMLTTRHISPDGFGLKNTTWNENSIFLEWRKNWADVNNRMFERKGLEQRIDHRSYKDQDIDREPMVHLGYQAAALERKGIQTERGDHNRKVQRRNERRNEQLAALKAEHAKEIAENAPNADNESTVPITAKLTMEEMRENVKLKQLEKELQNIRQTQKITLHIEKPIEPEPPYVSALEKQLKAEKATQHIEKMQEQQNTAEKIAKRMNALKEKYIQLETEKNSLMTQHNKDKLELPPLEYRAELMDEHAENIETLKGRLEQLQESRRNLRLLDLKKKKETDEKITQATQDLGKAQDFFRNRFHIDPTQAPAELKRLQEEIRTKKDELATKQVLVEAIREKQDAIELEYHTQKLLNETRPDHQQITQLLEQTHNPPETTRDQQLRERIEHQLNTITDNNFQKAIDNLPPYQAHILSTIREQAKEREELLKFEREQAFLTRYYQIQDRDERKRLLRAEDERRNRTITRSR
jgi:hypothetical protein